MMHRGVVPTSCSNPVRTILLYRSRRQPASARAEAPFARSLHRAGGRALSHLDRVRLAHHAVPADGERHQILSDHERTIVAGANARRQLFLGGGWNVGLAVERYVRKHGVAGPGFGENLGDHFRICEIFVESAYEIPAQLLQTCAPN